MEFTKENIPDLLEYLAGYMRENPEVDKGFGLEVSVPSEKEYSKSNVSIAGILNYATSGTNVYRIKPETHTVYGPDGVGVECPAPYREKLRVGWVPDSLALSKVSHHE